MIVGSWDLADVSLHGEGSVLSIRRHLRHFYYTAPVLSRNAHSCTPLP